MTVFSDRARLNTFWFGRTWGALGAGVLPFCVGLIAVTTLEAGPAAMAAITVALLAPRVLFTLHAGAYVERLGRWRSMLWANVAELTIWCGVIGYSLVLGQPLWLLIAAVLLSESARTVNGVAFQSVAPLLTGRTGLRSANAKFGVSDAFAQVAAPVIGSWVFLAAGGAATLLVGVSMIAVLIVVIPVCRTTEVVPDRLRGTAVHRLVVEGLRFVGKDRILRGLALSNMSANFFLAYIAALWLLYLLDHLDWSPSVVGVVSGVGALGGLLGGPVALFLGSRIGDSRTLVLLSWIFCPAYLIALIPAGGYPRIFLVTASTALVALCLVAYNVLQRTLRQSITPPDLLSRLSASIRFTSAVGAPVGAALGGALATFTTVEVALAMGIAGLIAPGILTTAAGLWHDTETGDSASREQVSQGRVSVRAADGAGSP